MGNTVSFNCYERLGKRTPDGPLINFDPQKPNNGGLTQLIENFEYGIEFPDINQDIRNEEGTNNTHIYKNEMNRGNDPLNNPQIRFNNNTNTVNNNPNNYNNLYYNRNNMNMNNMNMNNMNMNNMNMNNMNNEGEGLTKILRTSRRRPTYSPNTRKIEIDSDDEEDDKFSTDNSNEKLTASDIKAQKIKQYRKMLTKVVKIKTAIFHETVKVTCSKDGKMLEWYKGKSDANGKKKPIGCFPLNKITSVRTKSDNVKSLEIAVSCVNISTYLFIFKSRDEREEWQSNLESFKKIMSMK